MLTQARLLGQFFRPRIKELISLLTLSLVLAACGGGGGGGSVAGGGIGGTGAVGTVSAISSITVNGVTYGCVGAVVTDDDGIVAQGSGSDNCIAAEQAGKLSVGSVVVVTGSRDSSGNFSAETVDVSSSVAGPAINVLVNELSFSTLDQTVLVDEQTRFEIDGTELSGSAGLTALAAAPTRTVEISGYRNSSGDILATLVETKTIDFDKREIKGFAVVDGNTITIGGVNIILNGQDPPPNGACVEAKGTWTPGTLTLTQALKSDDDCDGGALPDNQVKAEVEGVISGINTDKDQFNVGGQRVITTAATDYEGGTKDDLLNGMKVEAEGPVADGTLIATTIQIKSNGVRIEGEVDSVSLADDSFTVLGITVKIVTATNNDFGQITAGSRLRVEGNKSGDTQVTAARISNASGGSGDSRTELRGPLDADPVSPTFNILGVLVQAKGSTEFDGGSAAFFANTKKDEIVKVQGTENNDVITAEQVENED